MICNEFNEKYGDYLVDNHNGLTIEDPGVIDYLDSKFKVFIKREGFRYYSIDLCFGSARFYADELHGYEFDDVEFNIEKLLKGKLNPKYL